MPIHTRYAAPIVLRTLYAVADVARMAETPRADAVAWIFGVLKGGAVFFVVNPKARLEYRNQLIRDSGATTIFFEALVSPAVARVVAESVGASTAVLDPIEGLEPGATGDYLTVMRDNLAALESALGCA